MDLRYTNVQLCIFLHVKRQNFLQNNLQYFFHELFILKSIPSA